MMSVYNTSTGRYLPARPRTPPISCPHKRSPVCQQVRYTLASPVYEQLTREKLVSASGSVIRPGYERGVPCIPTIPSTTQILKETQFMHPHFLHQNPAMVGIDPSCWAAVDQYISPAALPHIYDGIYNQIDLHSPGYRKNVTKETTGPLKAWLQEHRKNPYPTKAEKIMLAIITKMTLTQVSTWFANARRRLKKETGSPDSPTGSPKRTGSGTNGSIYNPDSTVTSPDRYENISDIGANSDDRSEDIDVDDVSDDEQQNPNTVSFCSTPSSMDSAKCGRVLFPHTFSDNVNTQTFARRPTRTETNTRPESSSSTSSGIVQPLSRTDNQQSPPDDKPKIWSISSILDS